jgi:hypothetical protein
MNAALATFTISAVLATVALLLATPKHHTEMGKSPWPEHATTHIWQGVLWATGLSGAMLILAWGPLASGERWAWWALAFLGAMLHGGYLVPLALREPHRLSRTDRVFFGGLALLHASGLTLSWSPTA